MAKHKDEEPILIPCFLYRLVEEKMSLKDKIKYKLYKHGVMVHHKRMVRKGYLDEEGAPLKCTKCNSKNITTYMQMWGDGNGILEEYSVKCKDCDTHLGTNSYGSWDTW